MQRVAKMHATYNKCEAGGVQEQPAASSVKHAASSMQQACTQHTACSKHARDMQQSCSKQCGERSMLHDTRVVPLRHLPVITAHLAVAFSARAYLHVIVLVVPC